MQFLSVLGKFLLDSIPTWASKAKFICFTNKFFEKFNHTNSYPSNKAEIHFHGDEFQKVGTEMSLLRLDHLLSKVRFLLKFNPFSYFFE
jgi:hypothetical protein